jgi:hypothetical protein
MNATVNEHGIIMSTATTMPTASTASTANIRETIMRKVIALSADYCPQVLHYIETLEEDDCENWSEEQWKAWLASNPPIPIEDDPFFTPEHIERIRQRSKAVDEGKAKVIPFDDDEWEDFWQEIEHSPEKAKAKAENRRCYLTPKHS